MQVVDLTGLPFASRAREARLDRSAGRWYDACGAERAMRPREPRLWSTESGASWSRVGRLVDANAIAQTVMAQLTGGVFLTGFALALGGGPAAIGVISAIPLSAKASQLVLSWWIERLGHWKHAALRYAVIARGGFLLMPLLLLLPTTGAARVELLIAVLVVSSLAAAVYELAFLTWMAELIPEPLRGVFWGVRGRNAGLVGIVASLIAAGLIDQGRQPSGDVMRFALLFGCAAVVGIVGVAFLRRLPAPRRQHTREHHIPMKRLLAGPIRDANFRRFVAFSALWSIASGSMAPFYMVYLLRQLNLSFVAVTLLTALTNVLMAVTQAHWGRLADHFGNKPVLRVGAYLIALTPLVWLTTAPGRAWPIVAIQVLSGVGWSAFHVSQNNLALKLAPETSRPSYLALFGAVSGLAEGLAPLAVGILLSLASGGGIPGVGTFRILMLGQLVLFGATSFAPGWIQEPGGRPVGHLIRVMARFRSMDASRPVSLVYEYAYTHLARIADMVALEFPRDAETLP